ncbi:ComEC family competence protein [Candidatus Parcubacteria bacterium]|nr:ComEC family competence protein [Candidatus Parcubacteria bacterium]
MKNTESISKRNNLILVCLWAFILGVLVSSFIKVSPVICILLFIIACGVYLSEKIWSGEVKREIFLITLTIIFISLGSFRYAVKDFHEEVVPSLHGVVLSEPERLDNSTRFILKSENQEKILVSTDMYSEVQYGDEVSIEGKLKKPGVITDESGRDFDYGAYLSKDDIYWTTNFASVSVISHSSGNFIKIFLFKVKNKFVSKIKEILPEPQSSLLAGLIVAGKEALPGGILDEFRRAGVVHIVVLSGYNITIIGEFFLALLGFLSLKKRTLLAALGIILFVVLTGATATVVRAGVMALIVLLARVLKRNYSPSRALLLTGVFMLVENPKILVFDSSFELTFLAMISLIYVVPLFEDWIRKLLIATSPTLDREQAIVSGPIALISVTLATQIVVLPYLLYNIGNFSTVFILSNLLILLVVPWTMLVGFIATMLAFVSPIVAWPLAFISHVLLSWILGVAHFLGNLSFASIQISHFPLWLTLLLYLFLVLFLFSKRLSLTLKHLFI